MGKQAITITVDTDDLQNVTDQHLAALWHVAQANPANWNDKEAGEIAEDIGREIIRRYLTNTAPALWNHQGKHYYYATTIEHLVKVDGEWRPKVAEAPKKEGALFIYGPQGCGKTLNADYLAAHYGKAVVTDYDSSRPPASYSNDALVFTSEPIPGAIPFEQALAEAGLSTTLVKNEETAEPPCCQDCDYLRNEKGMPPLCGHPSAVIYDPVTRAKMNPCRVVRDTTGLCGTNAALFVRKIADRIGNQPDAVSNVG